MAVSFWKRPKLPKRLERRTLADLKIGQSAYVVPWAMWADANRDMWVKTSHTPNKIPGGTVEMLVTRVPTGFEVDLPRRSDYRWDLMEKDPDWGDAPVVKFTNG